VRCEVRQTKCDEARPARRARRAAWRADPSVAMTRIPRSYFATGRAIFAIGILLHCNIVGDGEDADLAFDKRKERS